MAEKKDIHAFAREYLALFTDENTQEQMIGRAFGEQCQQLGFVMDGGRGFIEKYSGEAYDDAAALSRILDTIDDPLLLGSAIFSRWRYLTHWSAESILDAANRSWFVAALGRLSDLTGSDRQRVWRLSAPLEKVELISNNRSSGKRPTFDDQIEQRLTIRRSGRTSLLVADYQTASRGHKMIRRLPDSEMSADETETLFDQIARCFRYTYASGSKKPERSAAPGMWKLILTDKDGRTYTTVGPLGSKFPLDGLDMSDRLRQAAGNGDLLAFDGNPDLVNRLEVRYRSGRRDPETGSVVWNYQEQIQFDRRTESAEHVVESSPGMRVRHSYYIKEGVSSFLDTIDERSFTGIQGNPPDVVEAPGEEIRGYEIGVYTRRGKNRVIRGTYDKRALPRDWDVFVDQMLTFLSFYGFGQIFDAERYAVSRRRSSDHVYLSVVFDGSSAEYTYLAEDNADFHVDDFVMVPVGSDNRPTMAQIMSITYGSSEEAPYPYRKLKKVIRKSTPEDFRRFHKDKEQEQPFLP